MVGDCKEAGARVYRLVSRQNNMNDGKTLYQYTRVT